MKIFNAAGMTGRLLHLAFCACVVLAAESFCGSAARAGEAADSKDKPAQAGPIKLEQLKSSQIQPRAKKPVAPPRPAETMPSQSTQPAQTRPSVARDEVSRMLMEDPVVPVTVAKGYQPRRNERNEPLPIEGKAVVNRTGKIHMDKTSGWLIMTFDNTPGQDWLTSRRLLPCQLLEKVEQAIIVRPDAKFTVIGETTVYNKNAYMMLQRAAIAEDAPAKPSPPTAKKPAASANKKPSSGSSLIEAMLKDKPTTALRVVSDPKSKQKIAAQQNARSVAPPSGKPLSAGGRAVVIDRVVRLVKDPTGQWWTARFQSDNTLREPPLRVLPNSILTKAVYLNRQMGQSSLKLRISGDITQYKGRRYLLMRKMFPQRDLEQF